MSDYSLFQLGSYLSPIVLFGCFSLCFLHPAPPVLLLGCLWVLIFVCSPPVIFQRILTYAVYDYV